MTNEGSKGSWIGLTPEEFAGVLAKLDESPSLTEVRQVLPLLSDDPERAEQIALGVEEAVGWGHRVTVAIGEKDNFDIRGLRVARILHPGDGVMFHAAGVTAEEALTLLLDPGTRIGGDMPERVVNPYSGGLDRVPTARVFTRTLLDQAVDKRALVVGVSSESGSITATFIPRPGQGLVARGSGNTFPDALEAAIKDIR